MGPRLALLLAALARAAARAVLAPEPEMVELVPAHHQAQPAAHSRVEIAGARRAYCAPFSNVPAAKFRRVAGCEARRRPLIVVAGEGKTGTQSMSTALAMLGLKVAHFNSIVQCCNITFENPDEPNETIFGIDTGIAGPNARPVCKTTARYSGETCSNVSWEANDQRYIELLAEIENLPLEKYDDFNWCIFDDYDVVADVPIPFIATYLYSAYGSGTRVINTVRGAVDWTERRAGWDVEKSASDLAPMGWMFAPNIATGKLPTQPTSVLGMFARSKSAMAYAYLAERSLLRCTTDTADYLELDVFAASNDPPALWASLSSFLGLSTDGLNISEFPNEAPPFCHSENVRALYKLRNSSEHQLGVASTYAEYKSFIYFPSSMRWLSALLGCKTSVVNGTMPLESLVDENWRSIFFAGAQQVVKTDIPFCSGDAITITQCRAVALRTARRLASVVERLYAETKGAIDIAHVKSLLNQPTDTLPLQLLDLLHSKLIHVIGDAFPGVPGIVEF